MNTQEYIDFIPIYIKRLEDDGFSKDTVDVGKWITNHFRKYCLKNNISNIDMKVISTFYLEQYDIDIYNLACIRQATLRKPLLTLFELYETNTYYKNHPMKSDYVLNEYYSQILYQFQQYINDKPLAKSTQHATIVVCYNFLKYLESNKFDNVSILQVADITHYIASLTEKNAPSTIKTIQGELRLVINWMYENRSINFTGKQAVTSLKREMRNKLLSTYSDDEINKILNSINTDSSQGKEMYAIICLAAFLGLRASDIVNLRFDELDWENNTISIIQQKTRQPIHLPLIDEVKFPLLDYIKYGRRTSKEDEYIFTTFYPPYTKFKSSSSIYRVVTRAMDIAGIEFRGRHHGPHALRHSMATNMINNSAPISAISSILGHQNTKTTDIYITTDTTHMKKLTLEVPYGF